MSVMCRLKEQIYSYITTSCTAGVSGALPPHCQPFCTGHWLTDSSRVVCSTVSAWLGFKMYWNPLHCFLGENASILYHPAGCWVINSWLEPVQLLWQRGFLIQNWFRIQHYMLGAACLLTCSCSVHWATYLSQNQSLMVQNNSVMLKNCCKCSLMWPLEGADILANSFCAKVRAMSRKNFIDSRVKFFQK